MSSASPDRKPVDREEVRPLHEREAADAECGHQHEFARRDRDRRRARCDHDRHEADERAGRADLRQPLRVEACVLDHLDDGRIDGVERRRGGNHRVPDRGRTRHPAERIPP
jgi:hypothetical protein